MHVPSNICFRFDPTLTAMLQKFSISTRAKKPIANTMHAEMLRACVTQGVNISSEELGIWLVDNTS